MIQLAIHGFRSRPASYERVVGGYIAFAEASGQVWGDLEGVLTVRITQLLPAKPEAFAYRMAYPVSTGAVHAGVGRASVRGRLRWDSNPYSSTNWSRGQ